MSDNNTTAPDLPTTHEEKRAMTDGGEDEDPYGPMTWYLEKDTRRKFKRWFKQMELDYPDVIGDEGAPKWVVYSQIAKLAMEHEDQIVEDVEGSM